MTGRERILAHLKGDPVDRLPLMPITMQFACDQIGARYRDYCTDYRVLAEGQLRTAEKFDFDYLNTMSDPAREAADCGAVVRYFDDQPAAIVEEEALLTDKGKLAHLQIPDPRSGGRMYNGIKAVETLQHKANGEKLIEGWIEGPCAEAADLRGINHLMLDFFDDPSFVRDLFEFVVEMEIGFAQAQVEAGADCIGIGDAAASLVGPQIYNEFVWPCEKRMVEAIHAFGARVRMHICGNTKKILAAIGTLGCDIVDLDSAAPVSQARATMGPAQILLGNINPVTVLLDGDVESVTRAIRQCHHDAGPRYIVGAGCEVPRNTPPENLRALGEYARCHKPI
jgi:MtaA/CmuA family methyltransferase